MNNKFFAVIIFALVFLFFPLEMSVQKQLLAQNINAGSGLPLPRFVSLQHKASRLRSGPKVTYPVLYLYQMRDMPVEIIAEFGKMWRQIRDFKGTEGWMHRSQLSSKRTVIITQQTRTLRVKPDSGSQPLARLEPGVIANLINCPKGSGWCKIEKDDYEGWLRKVEFWGVDQGKQ